MGMKVNQSPWSKKVMTFSNRRLDKIVTEMMDGKGRGYVTKWEPAIEAAVELGVLKHPRYLQPLANGDWAVKEHGIATAVATGPTGPIAICRAIVIVVGGQGRYYSKHNRKETQDVGDDDSDRHGWGSSGLCQRSVEEVRQRKPVHKSHFYLR